MYAQYAYDAVWTIALAFNSTLSQVRLNETQQSRFRELLRAELSEVNFLGTSVSLAEVLTQAYMKDELNSMTYCSAMCSNFTHEVSTICCSIGHMRSCELLMITHLIVRHILS